LGRVEEIIQQSEKRHQKDSQQQDDIHSMAEEGSQVFIKTRRLVRIRFGGLPISEKGFTEYDGFLLRLKGNGRFPSNQEVIDPFRFRIHFHFGMERSVGQEVSEFLRVPVNQLPLKQMIHEGPIGVSGSEISGYKNPARLEVFIGPAGQGLEEGIFQVIGQSGGVDKVQGSKGMLIPAEDPAEYIGLHKADDGPVGKHVDFLMSEFQRLGVRVQADGLDGGRVRFFGQKVK
jgi:hypothetical protein